MKPPRINSYIPQAFDYGVKTYRVEGERDMSPHCAPDEMIHLLKKEFRNVCDSH